MAYPILRRTLLPFFLHRIGSLEGTENIPAQGPFIVAANHVSFIEPALIVAAVTMKTKRRVGSLTAQYVWNTFRKFGIVQWLGMLPVIKSDKSHALAYAEAELRKGNAVMLFPEGQRNDTSVLLPAKTGAARLALATNVPIVPAGYLGPPGWKTRESIRNVLFRNKEIHLRFGKPFSLTPVQGEVTKEILEEKSRQIMLAIAPLCNKTYPH